MSYRPGPALLCSKTRWRPWGRRPKVKGCPLLLCSHFSPRVAPLGRCETIQKDKGFENSPFWTRTYEGKARCSAAESSAWGRARSLEIRVGTRPGSKKLRLPLEFSKPGEKTVDRDLRSQMQKRRYSVKPDCKIEDYT